MKKLYTYSYIILSAMLGMVSTACTEETEHPDSPLQNEGMRAYFMEDNTTSYTFLPDDMQELTLTIGRQSTEAGTVHLTCDAEGVDVPATVDFAAGEQQKTVTITCNLEIGESVAPTVVIANEDSYLYGVPSLTVDVLRDYTWEDAGTASYTDALFGLGTGNVTIQKAKEDAEGTLYRLKDLYYTLSGGDADQISLKFRLDDGYNGASIEPQGEYFALGVGYYHLYDPETYPEYCYLTNEGNLFKVGLVLSQDGATPYTYYEDSFEWNGWPGEDVEESAE